MWHGAGNKHPTRMATTNPHQRSSSAVVAPDRKCRTGYVAAAAAPRRSLYECAHSIGVYMYDVFCLALADTNIHTQSTEHCMIVGLLMVLVMWFGSFLSKAYARCLHACRCRRYFVASRDAPSTRTMFIMMTSNQTQCASLGAARVRRPRVAFVFVRQVRFCVHVPKL